MSRLANTQTYGPGLWRTILSDQLCVTEEEFWARVDDRQRPRRFVDDEPPTTALQAQLVFQLISEAGIPEAQVARMSLDQAVSTMSEYWSLPPR